MTITDDNALTMRTTLFGPALVIPIVDRKLLLRTWQDFVPMDLEIVLASVKPSFNS